MEIRLSGCEHETNNVGLPKSTNSWCECVPEKVSGFEGRGLVRFKHEPSQIAYGIDGAISRCWLLRDFNGLQRQ